MQGAAGVRRLPDQAVERRREHVHPGRGPCVACVEPSFPDAFMPFFGKAESKELFADLAVDDVARVVIGASAIGAGIHAVKRLAIGESGREEKGERK